MTFLEALRAHMDQPETWMRPIGARGTGYGWVIRNDALYLVPSARGGVLASINVSALLDLWELVDPHIVCTEREDRI